MWAQQENAHGRALSGADDPDQGGGPLGGRETPTGWRPIHTRGERLAGHIGKSAPADRYVSWTKRCWTSVIAFGWIDGCAGSWVTPDIGSLIFEASVHHWARSYKERAARLIAEGRMAEPRVRRPSRQEAVPGCWDFMDDVDDPGWCRTSGRPFEANPAARGQLRRLSPLGPPGLAPVDQSGSARRAPGRSASRRRCDVRGAGSSCRGFGCGEELIGRRKRLRPTMLFQAEEPVPDPGREDHGGLLHPTPRWNRPTGRTDLCTCG